MLAKGGGSWSPVYSLTSSFQITSIGSAGQSQQPQQPPQPPPTTKWYQQCSAQGFRGACLPGSRFPTGATKPIPCSTLDNGGDVLVASASVAAIYGGIGSLVPVTWPGAAGSLAYAGISGGAGGLMNLAAKHKIGCTG